MPPSFTDDVMRAINRAPRPSPARALVSAVREGSSVEARGALSVAWRIVRHSTSMPVMVRAQALALVVLVTGSIVGGGVLGAVVAYRTMEPIVHSLATPGDDARILPDVVLTPRPAAPQETASPHDPRRPVPADVWNPRDERDDLGLDADEDAGDAEDGEEGEDGHEGDDEADDGEADDGDDEAEGIDDEDADDEVGESDAEDDPETEEAGDGVDDESDGEG